MNSKLENAMYPAAIVTFLSEPFGYIATVLKIVSFVPQILKIRKTNDTSSLSLGMYLLITATIICWILHVLVRKKERIDYPVLFANLVSLIPVGYIIYKIVTAPKADRENKNDTMKKKTKDNNVCKTLYIYIYIYIYTQMLEKKNFFCIYTLELKKKKTYFYFLSKILIAFFLENQLDLSNFLVFFVSIK